MRTGGAAGPVLPWCDTPSSQPAVLHWLQSEIQIGVEQRLPTLARRVSVTARGREPRSRHRLLRREVNERIAELTAELASNSEGDVTMLVFCECGTEGCVRPMEMTVSEYAAVREGPDLWVVSSAHVDEQANSLLAQRNGYALIKDVSERLLTEAFVPRKESKCPPTANSSPH